MCITCFSLFALPLLELICTTSARTYLHYLCSSLFALPLLELICTTPARAYFALHLLALICTTPARAYLHYTCSRLFALPLLELICTTPARAYFALHLLALICMLSCCLRSTGARWPIRDGDRVGRGRESDRLDRGNRPKKTGETVDRRQNNGSVKAVSPRHCPATCALRNCSFNCCAGHNH